MKNSEIAKIVDQLRGAALQFGQTQQLRSRIQEVVMPLLKEIQSKDSKIAAQRKIIDALHRGNSTMREAD